MIKIFRKIRHQLLTENKFSKYLMYAIGEIILVVVGILIALTINNRNESRKQHFNDVEFLKNVRSELFIETVSISSRIAYYHSINNKIKETIELLDTISILTTERRNFISSTIEDTDSLLPTYKNLDRSGYMLSLGALNRLEPALNENYLNYLDNFKFSYDLSTRLTTSLNESTNSELYPNVDLNFVNPNTNHIEFDEKTLKNNRSFFNALHKSIGYRQTVIATLKPLLSGAQDLIEQIDEVFKVEHN
jgi:hypothetical protein